MFTAIRRSTLLYPSGPPHDPRRLHLNIILTDPFGRANQVLMVGVESVRDKCDTTCILDVGDHSHITHPSFVAYNTCRIETAARIEQGVKNGSFVAREPINDVIYQRVTSGLLVSMFTKPFAQTFYKNFIALLK